MYWRENQSNREKVKI